MVLGILVGIMIGMIGALVGDFLTGSNTMSQNLFHLPSLLVAFIGVILLLAIVKLAQHVSVHSH